jgi:hypothetical protein
VPLGPFAKNVNTVWREAEKLLGDDTVLQAVGRPTERRVRLSDLIPVKGDGTG